jgi:hypothetical protein
VNGKEKDALFFSNLAWHSLVFAKKDAAYGSDLSLRTVMVSDVD